jgi:subtilisin family serine protease
MKAIAMLFLSCCFVFVSWTAATGNAISMKSKEAPGPEYVPGELLVKYKPSVRTAAEKHYRDTFGVAVVKTFNFIGVQHVKLPEGMDVEKALAIYAEDPDVEYAEPNFIVHAEATIPNDLVGDLWGLHNTGQSVNGTAGVVDCDIDAPEAWDICTGSSQVIIAVIDSGVDYNHPDLADNIWSNPGEIENGIDDDGNGKVDDVRGWDWVDDDNDPMDYNGHGTHCAGTIAAVGNNSRGVTGVCWSARLMPLRFLDTSGSGSTADAISAIDYANSMGAHVINNSWGGGGSSNALREAIEASPAVVVCAAGNSGADNDTSPHYPSNYDCGNIIAVAATDQNDGLASFSNYGATTVDVGAPGVNIYSGSPARQTVWSDDFDDGAIGPWTVGGTGGPFDLTNSQYSSASYSLADSPSGNYSNDEDHYVQVLASSSFSSYVGTKLEYCFNGVSELYYDYLHVETSTDGSTWTDHYQFSGSTGGSWYCSYPADTKVHEGNSNLYVRYRFTSDFSITDDGWYIDDVAVTAWSPNIDDSGYQFMNGTSMAAPHVAGLAALIKAYDMNLTNRRIKAVIEHNVDPVTSLTGKVRSGGRINAYKALINIGSDSLPAINILLLGN